MKRNNIQISAMVKKLLACYLPWIESVSPFISKREPLVCGSESCTRVDNVLNESGMIIAYFSSGLTTADPRAMGYGNG